MQGIKTEPAPITDLHGDYFAEQKGGYAQLDVSVVDTLHKRIGHNVECVLPAPVALDLIEKVDAVNRRRGEWQFGSDTQQANGKGLTNLEFQKLERVLDGINISELESLGPWFEALRSELEE